MATTATGCLAEERSADVIIQVTKPVLRQKKLYLITKRVFDIVCSFLGLLILAIPMMIIALIITIDSPGAPIFKQERLGINGKPFMIYKFRSMRLDAEEKDVTFHFFTISLTCFLFRFKDPNAPISPGSLMRKNDMYSL